VLREKSREIKAVDRSEQHTACLTQGLHMYSINR